MTIRNVTILGAGTLGGQIAWQTAFHGFNVTVYDITNSALENVKKHHQGFAAIFLRKRGATDEQIKSTFDRLTYTTNLTEAVKDADLTSESVPEDLTIKKEFYRELAKVAPEKTIFTTNTSSLLPSQFADETGRPKKFLGLHFANRIWEANVGEVMGHSRTNSLVFENVIEFARNIGMVPIPIHKEQHGYVMNSLLIPFLTSASNLLVTGVADHETIDKTWMLTSAVKVGPFGMMDLIGMETLYNVEKLWGEKNNDQAQLDRAAYIKENYIDKGKMGISTGEGFYKYPNPRYKDEDFIR